MEKQHLTPQELSDRWDGAISVKTLANWRCPPARGPKFRRLGNRIVYPLDAVIAYEKERDVDTYNEPVSKRRRGTLGQPRQPEVRETKEPAQLTPKSPTPKPVAAKPSPASKQVRGASKAKPGAPRVSRRQQRRLGKANDPR